MKRFFLFFLIVRFASAAVPESVVQQSSYLREILRQADDAYYNRHQSIMSDSAYDALREQYDRLALEYPELASASGVGLSVPEEKNRIAHTAHVKSLKKAYSDRAVLNFIQKCGTNLLYCVEPKIDGLTIILRYKDGLLAQAITRGDGKVGMDVSTAVLASGIAPSVLTNAPADLEVRGEIFITREAFKALNEQRRAAGLSKLKSPRNTAAGTLRLSDFSEISNRSLSLAVFERIQAAPFPASHSAALNDLKSIGLPVIESHTVAAMDVLPTIALIHNQFSNSSIPTDGVAIKVDDRNRFKQLGSTAHHPRGALARKYKETPVKTRLRSVDWTRGETGKLTPVARFDPIEFKGATVQNATLHNMNHIRAMDLRIGDWINVIRAGGSVPEIVSVCTDQRTGKEIAIVEPHPEH